MTESKAFKKQKYAWLDCVKDFVRSHDLPPSAFLLAHELTEQYFNEKHDGAAWPVFLTLGNDINMNKTTVMRLLRRMVELGILKAEWGRQGSGHSGRYWMVLKDAPAQLLDREKDAPAQLLKTGEKLHPSQEKLHSRPEKLHQRNRPLSKTPTKTPSKRVSAPISDDRKKQAATDKESFAEFWSAYPKHVAEEAARRAFATAIKNTNAETLIAGARRYASERAGQDGKYTKNPATWLRDGCWGDEPQARQRSYLDDISDGLAMVPDERGRPDHE